MAILKNLFDRAFYTLKQKCNNDLITKSVIVN